MTRSELLQYVECTVMLRYKTEAGVHTQSGVVYSVTQRVVVFWPLESDSEKMIKFKNIENIEVI